MMKKIGVAILGCGTVGSEVVRLLPRLRLPIALVGIAVRSSAKRRAAHIPRRLLTTDTRRLVADPRVGIVIELIGGTTAAYRLGREALGRGKSLITANKAMLDLHGNRIFALARSQKAHLAFEAAVGGGIPIIRALTEGFIADRMTEITAIINGTSNFILSTMTGGSSNFQGALREAKRLGYAEADPYLDVGGFDAAQKLALLIRIAFGGAIVSRHIPTKGMQDIQPIDIASAQRFGYVIKPLAVAKRRGEEVEARVHPAMIPIGNPLASVDGVMNAIFVKGDAVGEAMFYGKGAGGSPTASAVLSDLASVTAKLLGRYQPISVPLGPVLRLMDLGRTTSEYYLRVMVTDRPGVLARIAGILGHHHISISTVHQQGEALGAKVPIVILTHRALHRDMQRAVSAIDRLSAIRETSEVIRIEEGRV